MIELRYANILDCSALISYRGLWTFFFSNFDHRTAQSNSSVNYSADVYSAQSLTLLSGLLGGCCVVEGTEIHLASGY